LLVELSPAQGALQACNNNGFQKRFDEVVVRAGTHGLYANFHVVDTGSKEEGYIRMPTASLSKKLHAANAGHTKIGDNSVEFLSLKSRNGFFPIACLVQ